MSVDLMEITALEGHVSYAERDQRFSLCPSGQISQTELVGSPDWILYCLDIPSRQALFVELPSGSDLSEAVFVYSHQFATARRAALVPFEQFIAASDKMSPPAGLAFLFSTGRCGSLLRRGLLRRGRVASLVGLRDGRLADQHP